MLLTAVKSAAVKVLIIIPAGVFPIILQPLINKAWELGAVAVTLEVRESNIAAQKVYLTCGFASEGIRPNYYEDNHENAIIMWLYKEGKPDV